MAILERNPSLDSGELDDDVVYRNPHNPADYELADGSMSHAALCRHFLENVTPGAAYELPLSGTLWPSVEMSDQEVADLVSAIREVQSRQRDDWFAGESPDWVDL